MANEMDDGMQYMDQSMAFVVLGASGDLAKKKTYPSLFHLYRGGYLPKKCRIFGYARTKMTKSQFDDKMRPFLLKLVPKNGESDVAPFLEMCVYHSGQYDSVTSFTALGNEILNFEAPFPQNNRVFYYAIPPTQFANVSHCLTESNILEPPGGKGWGRVIIEKPFGRDLTTFIDLDDKLSKCFAEDLMYRIDHYLGKEMVQNLMVFRFSNVFLEPIWNRNHISSVQITFKEDIGTEGRGGYFDEFGIVRDVMQNHLLQILTIVAMEQPLRVSGEGYSSYVRNEKVKVLQAIRPIDIKDVVLGQYTANPAKGKKAYLDDDTVPQNSNCATFAQAVFWIDNPRWEGVPFILKCGKAMDESKGEVRIQFKPPSGSQAVFNNQAIPRNELVVRLQPKEAIYMKTNVKSPGLTNTPQQSELDLHYRARFKDASIPDAYTRLILDVFRGKQASFVRDDELYEAWKLFDPLLKHTDSADVKPVMYEYGTRGPGEAQAIVEKLGYKREDSYAWDNPYGIQSKM